MNWVHRGMAMICNWCSRCVYAAKVCAAILTWLWYGPLAVVMAFAKKNDNFLNLLLAVERRFCLQLKEKPLTIAVAMPWCTQITTKHGGQSPPGFPRTAERKRWNPPVVYLPNLKYDAKSELGSFLRSGVGVGVQIWRLSTSSAAEECSVGMCHWKALALMDLLVCVLDCSSLQRSKDLRDRRWTSKTDRFLENPGAKDPKTQLLKSAWLRLIRFLVALYHAMRLWFGYGFGSCDNRPRNVKNTKLAKHGPLFLFVLLFVGSKELVLKVPKRGEFDVAIRVTIWSCDSCAQGAPERGKVSQRNFCDAESLAKCCGATCH